MVKSFKQSVIEGLKSYVYALVDPRDNRIFYVGKVQVIEFISTFMLPSQTILKT